jgi:hypothetical protein
MTVVKRSPPVDLHRLYRREYAASPQPGLVEVGRGRYLTIEGMGEPGGENFQRRLGALYATVYAIKSALRAEGRPDFVVGRLEGLWWGIRGPGDFTREPPGDWNWKLMIRVPEWLTETDLAAAQETLRARGKDPVVAKVRLEDLEEGLCVQALHVGPYDREAETISRMNEFAREQRLAFHGLHHEVYLSDPRRTAPEKLRTILRMPAVKA